MTKTMNMSINTDLLAHLGFNLREIGKLKTKTAKLTFKEKPDGNPRSGVKGINWCKRAMKWGIYVYTGDKWMFCGYRAELDDAKGLHACKLVELEGVTV